MTHLNIEIKARTDNPERIEAILLAHHADYKGEDRQRDTYYKMTGGRLKLRQGNIENSLILYDRLEVEGLKKSEVVLQQRCQTRATRCGKSSNGRWGVGSWWTKEEKYSTLTM